MSIELKIPEIGESISEAIIAKWLKSEGDSVELDEEIVELETDKASVEIPSPAAGVLEKISVKEGANANVGDVIGYIAESDTDTPDKQAKDTSKDTSKSAQKDGKHKASKSDESPESDESPTQSQADDKSKTTEAPQEVDEAPPQSEKEQKTQRTRQDRISRDESSVEARSRILNRSQSGKSKSADDSEESATPESAERAPQPVSGSRQAKSGSRSKNVVEMSPIRRRIAKRLVESTQTAAMLTTFNEIDMSAVKSLRRENKDRFEQAHGVKLGFMSFFVKAAIEALRQYPRVNASIRDGDQIVYHDYYDLGIAVSTESGLVVPVLRNAEQLSIPEIEARIADYANRARNQELEVDELQGGTFTITNGGVFGSLLSTPILNPPQTGILGMHTIQDRPIALNGEIVIRPMMYIALTYDHRLIDGREAVLFLRRIKESIESPARMLLNI